MFMFMFIFIFMFSCFHVFILKKVTLKVATRDVSASKKEREKSVCSLELFISFILRVFD